jgi:hypothetical protein
MLSLPRRNWTRSEREVAAVVLLLCCVDDEAVGGVLEKIPVSHLSRSGTHVWMDFIHSYPASSHPAFPLIPNFDMTDALPCISI